VPSCATRARRAVQRTLVAPTGSVFPPKTGALFLLGTIDKEDLSVSLDATQKAGVKAILDTAAANVRTQGKTEKDPGRKRAHQRIADRARSAGGKENDFGLSVLALVRKFGFPDPDILQAFFTANPYSASDNWPGLLSYYRGAAIHSAYLIFREPMIILRF